VRALRSLPVRLTFGAVAIALLAGCASGTSDKAARAPSVRVLERDFRISIKPARVRAGTVRLVLHNKGPDTHELLIVRSPSADLPLRTDGLTIDEAALDKATVGVIEGKDAGSTEEMLLHLKPGRYELFCNMAGHYLGGMRAQLVVS
jgi:uncharacterized cupredoxin-like copper-binding protein